MSPHTLNWLGTVPMMLAVWAMAQWTLLFGTIAVALIVVGMLLQDLAIDRAIDVGRAQR